MKLPGDPRKRWFMYGLVVVIGIVFGEDAANAIMIAIGSFTPAL